MEKGTNFDKIKQWYDSTKSVKDNLKFAQNNNIKVGQRTLYNYCNEMGISTKGEMMEEPQNKAENSVILSDTKQGEETHQPMQENAIQHKIKHLQYVPNDEITNYINKTKNTMYFVMYSMAMKQAI